jgi:hypothetical protein
MAVMTGVFSDLMVEVSKVIVQKRLLKHGSTVLDLELYLSNFQVSNSPIPSE